MNGDILLGMAIQALLVSFLTKIGILDPNPAQQLLAGILFLIVSLLMKAHK